MFKELNADPLSALCSPLRYAYFQGFPQDQLPYISVPLHTLIKVRVSCIKLEATAKLIAVLLFS
jgi:hypothetical protein